MAGKGRDGDPVTYFLFTRLRRVRSMRTLRSRLARENGQTMTEYAITLVITVATVGGVQRPLRQHQRRDQQRRFPVQPVEVNPGAGRLELTRDLGVARAACVEKALRRRGPRGRHPLRPRRAPGRSPGVAGPPSPRITASRRAVQPRSLTWSMSVSVRTSSRTTSTCRDRPPG